MGPYRKIRQATGEISSPQWRIVNSDDDTVAIVRTNTLANVLISFLVTWYEPPEDFPEGEPIYDQADSDRS